MRPLTTTLVLVTALVAQESDSPPKLEPRADFEGVIEPYRIVELSPPVDGLLETVTVERGDVVEKGQVVATLESTVETATVEITRARAELEGELKKQEAWVEHRRTKFAHDSRLHAKGFVSDEEFDQSRADKLLAEAEHLQAEEALRLADLERKRAEAVLQLRTIRSPVDGVVVDRILSPGELVTRQYQSKIITIAQISPLMVQVMLPADRFGKIVVGDRAEVRTALQPTVTVEAEVTTVDQVVDSASDTFRVRLRLEDDNASLAAGLRCRVQFAE